MLRVDTVLLPSLFRQCMCNFRLIFILILTKSARGDPNACLCNHSHFHEFRSPSLTSFTFYASFSQSPSQWQQSCLTTRHILRHLDPLSGNNTTYTSLAAKVKPKCSDQHVQLCKWFIYCHIDIQVQIRPPPFFFSLELHDSQDLPVKKKKKKVDVRELAEDSHPR